MARTNTARSRQLSDTPKVAAPETEAKKAEEEGTNLLDQAMDHEADSSPEGLIKKHGTKSAAVRALTEEGMTTSAIAKALNIRYQHARNVQVQYLNKKKLAKAVKQAEEVKK